MIKTLVKAFVKNNDKVKDKKVRENYCVLGGILGVICNLFLFGLKLLIGIAMNSIAVMSDAFNNLSDMGSCVVAIIGAKMANRQPDREHPFGHGRIEYISSLIVSFIIALVGFELLKSSADKIMNPEPVEFDVVMVIILAASLLVKFWMYYSYNYIGKRINSSVMKATARDSINDVISTGAVIAATIAGHFLPFQTDGFVGVIVAIYIMYSGYKLAKETIDLLLGATPSKEIVEQLGSIVMSRNEICGIHDMMIHDYGPGRVFASVHAEVPDDADMVHIHEVIDAIERRIVTETGIQMVIHTDPVSVNNEHVAQLKKLVEDTALEIESSCSIHDFRITDGEDRINLIFDIIIREKFSAAEREKIVAELVKRVKAHDARLNLVITIDEVFA